MKEDKYYKKKRFLNKIMAKHLRKFANYSAYQVYLNSGDIALPRVSYIVNSGKWDAPGLKTEPTGPCWVDYSRLGVLFAEIANEGTLYLNDCVDASAYVEGDTLYIMTKNPADAYFDSSTGTIHINRIVTGN